MIRIVAALFLLFSFTIQIFQKSILVLDYYANKSAFEKKCENKFRLSLKCHGKCVLMKKLIAEQKKEQKNPELRLENKIEVFNHCLNYSIIPPFVVTINDHFQVMSIGKISDRNIFIFRPPAV